MRAQTRILALAALPIAMLTGCVSPPISAAPAPARTDDELRRLPIYDGTTGARVTWDQLITRTQSAQAILIGESHGHPIGLPGAAVYFEDIIENDGSKRAHADGRVGGSSGALALEFFERDDQPDIDAYLAGETDRDTFASGRGSSYPPGHERMLESAKEAGWEIKAANAPRKFVRLARTEGYDPLRETLTDEERALLVIPEALDEGPYRDRFFALMGGMVGHTEDTESTEPDPMVLSFFRAQQIWDATMADTVTSLVRDGHEPTVLVIGRFHIDHEGGTLVRTRQGLPAMSRVVSVTFANRDLGLLGLHPEDRGIADYVIYTGEQNVR